MARSQHPGFAGRGAKVEPSGHLFLSPGTKHYAEVPLSLRHLLRAQQVLEPSEQGRWRAMGPGLDFATSWMPLFPLGETIPGEIEDTAGEI